MDWSWALQFALAVASVVIDREQDFGGEQGLSASPSSGSREPRIVAVPPGSPVTIGLIFGVPISILIPVVRKRLADFGREGEAPLPGAEAKVGEGPSAEAGAGPTSSGANPQDEDLSDAMNEARGFPDDEDSNPSGLDNDVLHETQLRKLDDYFDYMEVNSDKCKRRMICEVAAAPEDFYPVSDIILRQIRPKAPIAPRRSSRFFRFLEAAKLGFNGDVTKCAEQHKCAFGGTDVFDPKILRVLQLLGRYLNIEFVDKTV